jgi:hypothetical protein
VGRQLWWGALVGATAGLAMLACALGLAGLGQPACLRPFLDLAVPVLPHAPRVGAVNLLALARGAAVHLAVASALGLVGMRALAALPWSLAGPLWLIGGSLGIALFDLAGRVPVMVDSPQSLEYLVVGLVLATWAPAGGPSRAPVSGVEAGPHAPRDRHARSPQGPHHAARHPSAAPTARAVLEVVLAPHCFGCVRAQALVAVMAARFPAVEVRVVDLAQPGVTAPPGATAHRQPDAGRFGCGAPPCHRTGRGLVTTRHENSARRINLSPISHWGSWVEATAPGPRALAGPSLSSILTNRAGAARHASC